MTHPTLVHRLDSERGIALVLSLFLMMAMSVVAASLMFMSQTETYSSFNYRLMSQARYGAESGVAQAANYLMWTYTAPTAGGADDLGNYTYNGVSPVTYNGLPVVLSANPNVLSNYPALAVKTAFNAAVSGTLAMAGTSVQYQPYATLMSMRQINTYGGGVQTIQTWQIVSDGTVSVGRTAKVEVTATIESVPMPAVMYGTFATNPGCGALTFSGSMDVDSYDSSAYNSGIGGTPSAANGGLSASGGNVGTNGNLGESGNATIDGTLSSPRVGVGDCSSGNIDALSASGNAKICPDPTQPCTGVQANATVQLPQAVKLPTPTVPTGVPTNSVTVNNSMACSALGLTGAATCDISGHGGNTVISIHPNGTTVSLGNITVDGNVTLQLDGGNYNLNSIAFSGGSNISITPTTGAVVMNVVGSGVSTPIDFTGGTLSNTTYNPALFQIEYAGTGNVVMSGNTTAAAMVYAPNAAGTLIGSTDFYGSIVTNTMNVTGNVNIHYDRSLSKAFYSISNPMLSAFSWKRF